MASKFTITAELNLQTKNLNQVVNNLRQQFQGADLNIKIKDLTKVESQLRSVSRSAVDASKDFNEAGNAFNQAFKRFTVITAVTGTLVGFTRSVKKAVGDAIEFEREVVKISQASGKTVTQLQGLVSEVGNVATSFGSSSKELLNAARTLTQAGFAADRVTGALKILAQTDLAATFDSIQDTTEGAIALLNQFGRAAQKTGQEAKFLEQSFSAINQVSKEFAVESSDLITAIRTTGSAFESAGGNLNELIALFTSVRSTTRESAESIATGFRTIFTRVQRVDTINALRNLGIELQDVEGKFVGPMEATKRLSAALSSIDPRDFRFNLIVEELGGFRQVSKVIPLIQQFTVAQKALGVAQGASGTLAKDAQTAQQSLAVQIAKTREEFSRFIRELVGSSSFQDTAQFLLGLANAFIKVADSIKPLLPLIAGFAAIKIGNALGVGLRSFGSKGAKGRDIPIGFAGGGFVPGSGNGDTVPAMLTPGEFVIRKSSVKKLGANNLARVNKYADGGFVVPVNQIADNKSAASATIERKGSSPKSKPVTVGLNKDSIGVNDFSIETVDFYVQNNKYKAKNGTKIIDIPDNFIEILKKNNKLSADLFEVIVHRLVGGALVAGNAPLDIVNGNKLIDAKFKPAGVDDKYHAAGKTLNYLLGQAQGGKGNKGGYSANANNTLVISPRQRVGNTVLTENSDEINSGKTFKYVHPRFSQELFAEEELRKIKKTYAISKAQKEKLEEMEADYDKGKLPTSEFQKLYYLRAIKSLYSDTEPNFYGKLAVNKINKWSSGYEENVDYKSEIAKAKEWSSEYNKKKPKKFATGGLVPGSGSGDTVPAMLTPGEFVIRKSSVQKLGVDKLHKINKYALGGPAEKFKGARAITIPRTETYTYDKPAGADVDEKSPDGKMYKVNALDRLDYNRINHLVDIDKENVPKDLKESYDKAKPDDRGGVFEKILLTLGKVQSLSAMQNARLDAISSIGNPSEIKSRIQQMNNKEFEEKLWGAIVSNADGSLAEMAMRQRMNANKWTSGDDVFNVGTVEVFEDVTRGLGKEINAQEIKTDLEIQQARQQKELSKAATANARAKLQAAAEAVIGDNNDNYLIKGEATKPLSRKNEIYANTIAAIRRTLNIADMADFWPSIAQMTEQELQQAVKDSIQRRASGGFIEKFANGGFSSGTDTIPAMLTPGEFVINKKSAQKIGYSRLNRMNKVGKYATGGVVQGFNIGGGVSKEKLSSMTPEELKSIGYLNDPNITKFLSPSSHSLINILANSSSAIPNLGDLIKKNKVNFNDIKNDLAQLAGLASFSNIAPPKELYSNVYGPAFSALISELGFDSSELKANDWTGSVFSGADNSKLIKILRSKIGKEFSYGATGIPATNSFSPIPNYKPDAIDSVSFQITPSLNQFGKTKGIGAFDKANGASLVLPLSKFLLDDVTKIKDSIVLHLTQKGTEISKTADTLTAQYGPKHENAANAHELLFMMQGKNALKNYSQIATELMNEYGKKVKQDYDNFLNPPQKPDPSAVPSIDISSVYAIPKNKKELIAKYMKGIQLGTAQELQDFGAVPISYGSDVDLSNKNLTRYTEEEIKAIAAYVSGPNATVGGKPVNSPFGSGGINSTLEYIAKGQSDKIRFDDAKKQKAAELAKLLDSAANKKSYIPEKIYSGIHQMRLDDVLNQLFSGDILKQAEWNSKNFKDSRKAFKALSSASPIGKTFSISSFLSTSRDHEVAKAFSSNFNNSVLLEIATKRSKLNRSRNIFLDGIEREHILPRNSQFKVNGMRERNGRIIFDVQQFAKGGSVFEAKGTDTVPAMLTPGEFVINKKSAEKIGYSNLNRMNKVGKYAKGGVVRYLSSGSSGSGEEPFEGMTFDDDDFDLSDLAYGEITPPDLSDWRTDPYYQNRMKAMDSRKPIHPMKAAIKQAKITLMEQKRKAIKAPQAKAASESVAPSTNPFISAVLPPNMAKEGAILTRVLQDVEKAGGEAKKSIGFLYGQLQLLGKEVLTNAEEFKKLKAEMYSVGTDNLKSARSVVVSNHTPLNPLSPPNSPKPPDPNFVNIDSLITSAKVVKEESEKKATKEAEEKILQKNSQLEEALGKSIAGIDNFGDNTARLATNFAIVASAIQSVAVQFTGLSETVKQTASSFGASFATFQSISGSLTGAAAGKSQQFFADKATALKAQLEAKKIGQAEYGEKLLSLQEGAEKASKTLQTFNMGLIGINVVLAGATAVVTYFEQVAKESGQKLGKSLNALAEDVDKISLNKLTQESIQSFTDTSRSASLSSNLASATGAGLITGVGAGVGAIVALTTAFPPLGIAVAAAAAALVTAGALFLNAEKEAANRQALITKSAQEFARGMYDATREIQGIQKFLLDIDKKTDKEVFERTSSGVKVLVSSTNNLINAQKAATKAFGGLSKIPKETQSNFDLLAQSTQRLIQEFDKLIGAAQQRSAKEIGRQVESGNYNVIDQAINATEQQRENIRKRNEAELRQRFEPQINDLRLAGFNDEAKIAEGKLNSLITQSTEKGFYEFKLGLMESARQSLLMREALLKEKILREKLLGTLAKQIAIETALTNFEYALNRAAASVDSVTAAYTGSISGLKTFGTVDSRVLDVTNPMGQNSADYDKAISTIGEVDRETADNLRASQKANLQLKKLFSVGNEQINLKEFTGANQGDFTKKIIDLLGIDNEAVRGGIQKALESINPQQFKDMSAKERNEKFLEVFENVNKDLVERGKRILNLWSQLEQQNAKIYDQITASQNKQVEMQLAGASATETLLKNLDSVYGRQTSLAEKNARRFGRQQILAGGLAGNPNAIGARLSDIRGQLAAGNLDQAESQKLASEANKLEKALGELADQGQRTADTLEEIAKYREQREAYVSSATRYAFGSDEDRVGMDQAAAATQMAVSQGTIEGLSGEQRQAVSGMLDELGPLGKDIKKELTARFYEGRGQGNIANLIRNASTPEQMLAQELTRIFNQEQQARNQLFSQEANLQALLGNEIAKNTSEVMKLSETIKKQTEATQNQINEMAVGAGVNRISLDDQLKEVQDAIVATDKAIKTFNGQIEALGKSIGNLQEQLANFTLEKQTEQTKADEKALLQKPGKLEQQQRKVDEEEYRKLGLSEQQIQNILNKKSNGGLIYRAGGGFAPRGTDTVPAMLTPGEFVMRKSAVDKYGTGMMSQINAKTFAQGGGVGATSGGFDFNPLTALSISKNSYRELQDQTGLNEKGNSALFEQNALLELVARLLKSQEKIINAFPPNVANKIFLKLSPELKNECACDGFKILTKEFSSFGKIFKDQMPSFDFRPFANFNRSMTSGFGADNKLKDIITSNITQALVLGAGYSRKKIEPKPFVSQGVSQESDKSQGFVAEHNTYGGSKGLESFTVPRVHRTGTSKAVQARINEYAKQNDLSEDQKWLAKFGDVLQAPRPPKYGYQRKYWESIQKSWKRRQSGKYQKDKDAQQKRDDFNAIADELGLGYGELPPIQPDMPDSYKDAFQPLPMPNGEDAFQPLPMPNGEDAFQPDPFGVAAITGAVIDALAKSKPEEYKPPEPTPYDGPEEYKPPEPTPYDGPEEYKPPEPTPYIPPAPPYTLPKPEVRPVQPPVVPDIPLPEIAPEPQSIPQEQPEVKPAQPPVPAPNIPPPSPPKAPEYTPADTAKQTAMLQDYILNGSGPGFPSMDVWEKKNEERFKKGGLDYYEQNPSEAQRKKEYEDEKRQFEEEKKNKVLEEKRIQQEEQRKQQKAEEEEYNRKVLEQQNKERLEKERQAKEKEESNKKNREMYKQLIPKIEPVVEKTPEVAKQQREESVATSPNDRGTGLTPEQQDIVDTLTRAGDFQMAASIGQEDGITWKDAWRRAKIYKQGEDEKKAKETQTSPGGLRSVPPTPPGGFKDFDAKKKLEEINELRKKIYKESGGSQGGIGNNSMLGDWVNQLNKLELEYKKNTGKDISLPKPSSVDKKTKNLPGMDRDPNVPRNDMEMGKGDNRFYWPGMEPTGKIIPKPLQQYPPGPGQTVQDSVNSQDIAQKRKVIEKRIEDKKKEIYEASKGMGSSEQAYQDAEVQKLLGQLQDLQAQKDELVGQKDTKWANRKFIYGDPDLAKVEQAKQQREKLQKDIEAKKKEILEMTKDLGPSQNLLIQDIINGPTQQLNEFLEGIQKEDQLPNILKALEDLKKLESQIPPNSINYGGAPRPKIDPSKIGDLQKDRNERAKKAAQEEQDRLNKMREAGKREQVGTREPFIGPQKPQDREIFPNIPPVTPSTQPPKPIAPPSQPPSSKPYKKVTIEEANQMIAEAKKKEQARIEKGKAAIAEARKKYDERQAEREARAASGANNIFNNPVFAKQFEEDQKKAKKNQEIIDQQKEAKRKADAALYQREKEAQKAAEANKANRYKQEHGQSFETTGPKLKGDLLDRVSSGDLAGAESLGLVGNYPVLSEEEKRKRAAEDVGKTTPYVDSNEKKLQDAKKIVEDTQKMIEEEEAKRKKQREKMLYRAGGGSIFKPRGTDTVPAMLTPGEFVVKKSAVDKIGVSALQHINNGGKVQYAFGGKLIDRNGFGGGPGSTSSFRTGWGGSGIGIGNISHLGSMSTRWSAPMGGYGAVNPYNFGMTGNFSNFGLGGSGGFGSSFLSGSNIVGGFTSAGLTQGNRFYNGPISSGMGMGFGGMPLVQYGGLFDPFGFTNYFSGMLTGGVNPFNHMAAFDAIFNQRPRMFAAANDMFQQGMYNRMMQNYVNPAASSIFGRGGGGSRNPYSRYKLPYRNFLRGNNLFDSGGRPMITMDEYVNNIRPLLRSSGGFINYLSNGGLGDTIPAMLTPGEFVMNKNAVDKHGLSFMNSLNNGKVKGFAKGGPVGTNYLANGGSPIGMQSPTVNIDINGIGAAIQTAIQSGFAGIGSLIDLDAVSKLVNSFATFTQSMNSLLSKVSGMTMTHNVRVDGNINIGGFNSTMIANAIKSEVVNLVINQVNQILNQRNNEAKN